MSYNPLEDGITHLNLYSKARTEIGRFLSNFSYCPIEIEDGHFDSIEGYWSWLSISEENPEREKFRTLSGYAAKKCKKELYSAGDKGRSDSDFSGKIERALHLKFQTSMARELMYQNMDKLQLPLVHYYAYGDPSNLKIVDVTEKYPEFISNVRKEIRNYLQEQGTLFHIAKGIICQQVNCQGVMGTGLAKAIMDEYPIAYQSYQKSFQKFTKEELFGKFNVIHLTKNLSVANCYTQFTYGNPAKTGRVYTDAEKLVGVVDKICKKYPDLPVYLPHTKDFEKKIEYGIGCGYGGETWEHLAPMFASLRHPNLFLLDTKTGRVHTFDEPFPEKVSLSKEERKQRPILCDPFLYEGRPIIFDFETTGLHPKTDEPLQLSIVNEDGEVIFESLLKPYHKQSWKDSEKVHHITPKMVMGKPHLDEYSDALRIIFEKASEVVGHNVAFDLRFLEEHAGITVDKRKVFDTCKEFRKREPNTGHKLTDAVAFYCPERAKQFALDAHNALYDTIATAAVYKVMKEKEREEIEYE